MGPQNPSTEFFEHPAVSVISQEATIQVRVLTLGTLTDRLALQLASEPDSDQVRVGGWGRDAVGL